MQSVPYERISSQPSSPVDIETFTHHLYQAHSASNSNGIQVWSIKMDILVDSNINCPPGNSKGLNQSMGNSWRSRSFPICCKSNLSRFKFKFSSLLPSDYTCFSVFLFFRRSHCSRSDCLIPESTVRSGKTLEWEEAKGELLQMSLPDH